MFIEFFYLMRKRGLKVSLNEWMALMEALEQGLAQSSLTSFYYLCRAILVKSETEYDKFDMAFAEFFRGIEHKEDIPEEVWDWLENEYKIPARVLEQAMQNLPVHDFEELQKMLEERLKEQKEEHHGGSHWIGTGGTSPFGHGGYNPAGIRIGGESVHRSAVQVAGERNFRDFREDTILDIRSFQMAFRKLRQFTAKNEAAKTELDIDATIQETCNNAGNLKLVFNRPRKNSVKVLLLFDSGGSMTRYSELCSRLFQAAHKSHHFKDIQTYYFHNCFYHSLFTDPSCRRRFTVDTMKVLNNIDTEYKVIVVGDAAMAPSELLYSGGASFRYTYNKETGLEWIRRVKRRYPHMVWLNPMPQNTWPFAHGNTTIQLVKKEVPMFELTVEGMDAAFKKLLVNR